MLLKKPLSEVPQEGSVGEDYFYRMLSPYALQLASPFLAEERTNLEKMLISSNFKNFRLVVVGCGELIHYPLARKYCNEYIGIEPLADIFVPDSVKLLVESQSNIRLFPDKFGEVPKENFDGKNNIWVFFFNIVSYIPDPISLLNQYIKPGDKVFVVTWNQTERAKQVRSIYFDYLNKFEESVVIDPSLTIGLCNLEVFPFEDLKWYKSSERIKGEITDTLIINC